MQVLKSGYAQFHFVLNLSLGLQIDDGHICNTSYIKKNEYILILSIFFTSIVFSVELSCFFFALPLRCTMCLLLSEIIIPLTYTRFQYFDAFYKHSLCNVKILLKGKHSCEWYSCLVLTRFIIRYYNNSL